MGNLAGSIYFFSDATQCRQRAYFFIIFQSPQNWVAAERIRFKLVSVFDGSQPLPGLMSPRRSIALMVLRLSFGGRLAAFFFAILHVHSQEG
jgi:hypothetical protein